MNASRAFAVATGPRDAVELAARRGQRRILVGLLAVTAYLAFSAWFFDITPQRLFGGLDKLWIVLRQMLVWRGMATWDYGGILLGLGETLAMAFLGTLLAALIALPMGFLAARNMVRVALVRQVVRRAADVFRGVDSLVWALVYVRAVGLGPLAGVLAIITRDIGDFTKLYSEAIENIDNKPMDGVRATGASGLQELRFGALPQVLPVLLSQVLYLFESNVRSATVLGVVGAGGIGLQLSERIRVQYWDQAAFIILLVLLTVTVIDTASRHLRQRFIGRIPG